MHEFGHVREELEIFHRQTEMNHIKYSELHNKVVKGEFRHIYIQLKSWKFLLNLFSKNSIERVSFILLTFWFIFANLLFFLRIFLSLRRLDGVHILVVLVVFYYRVHFGSTRSSLICFIFHRKVRLNFYLSILFFFNF